MRAPAAPGPLILAILALSGTASLLAETHESPSSSNEPLFVDRTPSSGVDFVHRHFGTGEKYMPENMGPGLAILDVDGDGRLDLFFVQGAPVAGGAAPGEGEASAGHRLFRQLEPWRFEDVSETSGVNAGGTEAGVGMGVTYGDVDRDGHLDLYVSRYGPDLLLRGRGGGSFEDATRAVGLGKKSWSTGATFVDADADGDLDLYVASYVDFALDNHRFCGSAARQLRSYCHPDVYDAVPDAFYRNDGGRFTEVSRQVGIVPTPDGKGLGVLAGDFDLDGDADLLVANDSTSNYLYLWDGEGGDGRGRFEESALLSGVARNGAGAAEASMGIDAGDVDGDGKPELLLTHLDQETNTLYRNLDAGLFRDHTDASGLGPPGLPWVGFGVVLFDADLDGDLDVAVANGHILDNIHLFSPERRHAQPLQFFENRGGRFFEIEGAFDSGPVVGRGLAAGDLDRDGDQDLVLTQNDGAARLFENRALPARGLHSLTVRLLGTASNPQGFGARLELKVGGRRLTREMRAASSYLSQGPPEVLFGLGKSKSAASLTIRWPSGKVDVHGPLEAGRVHVFTEGEAPPAKSASGGGDQPRSRP